MQLRKKFISCIGVATFLCIFLLNGCANQTQLAQAADVSNQQTRAQVNSELADASGNQLANGAAFHELDDRYVDTKPVVIPAQWKTKHVAIYAAKQPIGSIISNMTKETGVTNVFQSGVRDKLASIYYRGSLYEGLQKFSEKNNIFYSISGDVNHPTLNWSLFQTKTFQIAFLPGNTNFDVGGIMQNDSSNMSASQAGGSGAVLSGKAISIWKDLATSIKNILSKDGKLSVNQASSSITVTDTPFTMQRVAQFIDHYNKMISSRVAIKIKILEVQLNNGHASGIDWNAAYKFAKAKVGFTTGGFVTNAISSLTSTGTADLDTHIIKGPWNGSNFIISALDQQGKTTVVNEPTVVSLNNQPNTISIGGNEAYVKETSVTHDANSGAVTTAYTPGNIKTGMELTVIPHIQNNKVYLSLNVVLSKLKQITTVSDNNSNKDQPSSQIQLPQTEDRIFNQRIMADDNNLIVLSGFKLDKNNYQDSKNFGIDLLGGRSGDSDNVELVVLIQPKIIKRAI